MSEGTQRSSAKRICPTLSPLRVCYFESCCAFVSSRFTDAFVFSFWHLFRLGLARVFIDFQGSAHKKSAALQLLLRARWPEGRRVFIDCDNKCWSLRVRFHSYLQIHFLSCMGFSHIGQKQRTRRVLYTDGQCLKMKKTPHPNLRTSRQFGSD